TYMADHNARFAVAAAEEGTAFVPFVGDLAGVLCSKHARTVGNDNCVRFNTLSLQIPEQRHRRHYVRAGVEVREYPNGALAIFHGPRRLADYTAEGALITGEAANRSAAQVRSAAACGFVDDATPRPQPHRHSYDEQRTLDELQKPDIFTCYRQLGTGALLE